MRRRYHRLHSLPGRRGDRPAAGNAPAVWRSGI